MTEQTAGAMSATADSADMEAIGTVADERRDELLASTLAQCQSLIAQNQQLRQRLGDLGIPVEPSPWRSLAEAPSSGRMLIKVEAVAWRQSRGWWYVPTSQSIDGVRVPDELITGWRLQE
jgi:hypothetical protein